VQHGEDDVDPAEQPRAVLERHEAPGRGVAGQGDRLTVLDRRQLPSGQGQPGRVVRREHPTALGRDADRDDVVALTVHRRKDAAGRDAGDGVLGAAAAEHDGEAGAGRHGAPAAV
jgi:hypothetical protein